MVSDDYQRPSATQPVKQTNLASNILNIISFVQVLQGKRFAVACSSVKIPVVGSDTQTEPWANETMELGPGDQWVICSWSGDHNRSGCHCQLEREKEWGARGEARGAWPGPGAGRTEQRVTQFLMTAAELLQLSGSGRRLYLARLCPDLG